jgi:hypothetical protein
MALEIRPTFTIDLPERCAAVTERLRDGLTRQPVLTKWARLPGARSEMPCDGTFVLIAPPEAEQRFFSPWLQLVISRTETGTQLFGRFSPRPAVWTAYTLSYLFLACVAFFSLMLAVSQWLTGLSAWAFWITLGALLAAGIMWWIAQVGQRLAREQMQTLRTQVDAALKIRITPVAGAPIASVG